jgi:flavin reductase (DIM6/NTAB) family NADH-FMN oxidoreductase RutF/rubredoxin
MNLRTLWKISYGLYIVSSKRGAAYNGQIANTVFQLTADPPLIGACINKHNLTHEFVDESKVFAVSILSQNAPMQFIGLFGFKGGRDVDKFRDVKFKIAKTGAPIVQDNTIGYLECEVINKIDTGTHTLFIGKLVDAEIISEEKPMTYDYYHRVLKGEVPKTATTYIEQKQDILKKEGKMTKYRCTVCGYIYDPAQGDPESDIQPGTPFEELPSDWVCPTCGATKDQFEELD